VLTGTAQYWKKGKLTPIISLSSIRYWGILSCLYHTVNLGYYQPSFSVFLSFFLSSLFFFIYFSIDILSLFLTASMVWWLACWPLVPEFAGSIQTEAVGFFSVVKKSSACLPSEGK
jgi:hypothetical protein